MNLRLSNINLFVRDVEKSVRFYADVLGLEHDRERSHPPGFALLRSGEITITLQGTDAPGAVLGQAASFEVGFEATDLASVREKLAAAGSVVSALQTMGWGSGFDATDPDGFRLSVFQKRDQG